MVQAKGSSLEIINSKREDRQREKRGDGELLQKTEV